jgi:hypothetical protein
MRFEDLTDYIPADAVILNVLRIVEFMGADGEIYRQDLSCSSDGEDLSMGKSLELSEWARMFTVSPMLGELVHDYVFGEDEDGGEDEEPAWA